MRVLHLFSNWKLTGPAEPAINIASECVRLGMETRLLCGRTRKDDTPSFELRAKERAIEAETPLTLSKHWKLIRNLFDSRRLRRILADWKPDIVHCHADNDTRIALRAAKRLPNRPLVIRTSYSGSPNDVPPSELYLMRRVDALITVSREVAKMAAMDHSIDSARVSPIPTGIDLSRFTRDNVVRDLRHDWHAAKRVPLIGVVARIQARRRFDLLFEAFRLFLNIHPEAMLVVVGRGTRKKEVGEIPAQKIGLADRILFPGYIEGATYVEALYAFDALVYLVPGTDGSCRTVREAMVMGTPVVSSRRGILPELVEDGVNGWTVEENPAALCDAMKKITDSREELIAMSARTRTKAQERFALTRQGVSTKTFYEKLLENR